MAQRDFRPFAPRLRLFLELSTTLLKAGVARRDQQLDRAASGEHRHIAAVSRTANISAWVCSQPSVLPWSCAPPNTVA